METRAIHSVKLSSSLPCRPSTWAFPQSVPHFPIRGSRSSPHARTAYLPQNLDGSYTPHLIRPRDYVIYRSLATHQISRSSTPVSLSPLRPVDLLIPLARNTTFPFSYTSSSSHLLNTAYPEAATMEKVEVVQQERVGTPDLSPSTRSLDKTEPDVEAVAFDEKTTKRLLRRLDLVLMPFLSLLYL